MVFASGACSAEVRVEEGGRTEWQVGETPTLVIGGPGAAADALLHQVTGAARRDDGGAVVADGGLGSSRLAEFDADGSFRRLWGGSGEGPGEFAWITAVVSGPQDSVFAFDAQLQRLTVFDVEGQLGRTANLRSGLRAALRVRTLLPLSDGYWMARELGSPVWAGTPEVRYDTVTVGVLDPSLSDFTPLRALPGPMSTTVEVGGRRSLGAPAFAPYPSVATWGRCIFTTTGATSSILVHSMDGRLVRTLDGPGAQRPVTEDDQDAFLAYRLQSADPEDEAAIRARHREAARMSHLPYYHQLVVDEWGNVWLQEYSIPVGTGAKWYVVSQAGELLGEVTWPKALDVYAIDADGVLGRTRGELDEERVELLPWLVEAPGPRAAPLAECIGEAGR